MRDHAMRKNISSALAGFLAALLLWCLLPVTAEAAGASFSGSGSVRAGDSVTVTFSVSGSNIQGITAVLHYDSSALTLTGTRQLIGDSWSVDMSGGNLLAYDQSLNNPISGSSAVLAVTFRVKSGVAAGTKVSAAITDIVTSDGNSDQNLNDASWSASVASPPSGNANLSGLSCGSYALSPSFSAGTTEYSVTVPYDVSRLPLDYSAADGGANVSVSGNQLSVGVNTVVLTVTAANGATRRYTISVTRQPDPTATLSSDADLADLTPSEGKLTPAFAPNITEYAVYVPYETTKLSLSATAKDSKALGVTQPDAALKQGDNVLTVTCTAEDGTTRDYTVHVVRMPGFAGTLPQIGEPEPEAPAPEPDDQQPGPFRSLWTALCAPVDLPLLTGRWVPLYAILALHLVVLLVALFFIGRSVGISRSRRRILDRLARMEQPEPQETQPEPEHEPTAQPEESAQEPAPAASAQPEAPEPEIPPESSELPEIPEPAQPEAPDPAPAESEPAPVEPETPASEAESAAPEEDAAAPAAGPAAPEEKSAPEDALPVYTPPAWDGCPRTMRILFGHALGDGAPVCWYPNDTARIFHPNMGIIGTMGTGKTQMTKSLVTQLCRQQPNNFDGHPLGILIFDYKGDYNETKPDFVQAAGARVLKPYHLPFNPFSLQGVRRKPQLPIHTANAFTDIIARIYGLGPKQSATLLRCIVSAYQSCGIESSDPSTWDRTAPTFEQVYQVYADDESIKKNDSLYAAMDKLFQFQVLEGDPDCTSSLFGLLRGVVVIDLSGYDTDIQNLIVAITLELFYSQMQNTGSSQVDRDFRQLTRFILVDEADNFMSQNFPALKRIMKEGREFGVGTILSTQFLRHFGSGDDDYSSYILTWVVHNVSDLKRSDIDFVFKSSADPEVSEQLYQGIKAIGKHQSIVKAGNAAATAVQDMPFWQIAGDEEQSYLPPCEISEA